MSITVQLKRGTTAEHASFTGKEGEITYDKDKKIVIAHDNSTAGGIPLAKEILTTKGDILTFDTASQRLGVGTDGQVLTADSAQAAGVKWADASGGGPADRIYVPGGTVNAYDDEFDDGSIDGDWAAVDVTSYANSWYEPSGIKGLSGSFPAGKGTWKYAGLLKSFTGLDAPFYIETAVRLMTRVQSYPLAGLWFSDGVTVGSGAQVYAGYTLGSWSSSKRNAVGWGRTTGFNARTNFGEVELQPANMQDHIFIRLAYESANTFRVYSSLDGIAWFDMSGALSYTLTPTYFGVLETTHDNSPTYAFGANFAYFRVRSGSPTNG